MRQPLKVFVCIDKYLFFFQVHMCRMKVANKQCFYYNNLEGNLSLKFKVEKWNRFVIYY